MAQNLHRLWSVYMPSIVSLVPSPEGRELIQRAIEVTEEARRLVTQSKCYMEECRILRSSIASDLQWSLLAVSSKSKF
jgi:hypothetical protein